MKRSALILFLFLTVSSFFGQEVCNTYTVNPGTYISEGTIIPFNPDNTYYEYINVPANYSVSRVTVTIDISHSYDGDLEIFLVSPSGTEVLLSSDNGGSGDNYTTTTFDDSASVSISDGAPVAEPPFDGNFTPEGFLSEFVGEPSEGDWALKVVNKQNIFNSSSGTINSINLQLCYIPIGGYTGPGGVGQNDGSSALKVWLRGDDINADGNTTNNPTNNANISNWNDFSGNSFNYSQGNVASQPTYLTSGLNGVETVFFDGNNFVSSVSNTYNSNTALFVLNANDYANESRLLDDNANYSLRFEQWNNTSEIGYTRYGVADYSNTGFNSPFGEDAILSFSKYEVSSNYNLRSLTSSGENSTTLNVLNNNSPLPILSLGRFLQGNVSEVIVYNKPLTTVEKIITDNYLSAKYNVPLLANNFYDEDENGDFDFDVAGIGQASDGTFHTDSQGTGIVRINTPSSLSDGDYLFWGRNTNTTSYSFSTIDYKERLNSIWRVSKRSDLGTVSFAIDMTGIDLSGIPSCKSLQLIIDDNSNFSSPESVINLTNTTGDLYETTLLNFNDGDYFTLQYIGKIILDNTGFHNGSNALDESPTTADDCLDLLVKSNTLGTTTPVSTRLSQNANVKSLEVESLGNFVIEDGLRIQVTNGIQLDGDIRLLGDAQIIQTHSGTSLISGSGKLYRDQVSASNNMHGGTPNFKALYWSSPVSSSSNGFVLDDVLKDGTNPTTYDSTIQNIDFVPDWDGEAATLTDPIKISTHWLTKLINGLSWDPIVPNSTPMEVGEGWSMRGTDANNQNFTFYGTPNDGTYTITGATPDKYFLLGNPYPSAIDAVTFMGDNANVLEPTMYFYDSTNDYSYYYDQYEGGYGVLNSVGMGAPAPGSNTKVPKRYLAIGQGFLMYTPSTISDTTIEFNNAQRIFRTRSSSDSEFIAKGDTENQIPILRISFEFNEESIGTQKRSLAVGFYNKTNSFEPGFDVFMLDRRPTDLGLKTVSYEENPLVISVIENFNKDLEIPLLVYLDKDREVAFKIYEKKDFPDTDIYLKDAETNQYYNISNPNLSVNIELSQGNYLDRFSIVFKNENSLSTDDIVTDKNLNAFVDKATNEIVIQQKNQVVKTVQLFNLVGQEIATWKNTKTTSEIRFKKQNLQTSVYILKLKTEEGKEFTKKIILK